MPSSLPARITLISVLASLLPIGLAMVVTHTFSPILIGAAILGAILIGVSSYRLLKPLEQLYQSAQVFAKGEFQHRVNISQKGELGLIAKELNQMADYLIQSGQAISQNQSQLVAQKNRWEVIFATILEGVIVVDVHRQLVLMNKAAENITGYTMVEAQGQPIDQIVNLTEKDGREIKSETYCPIHLAGEVPPQSYRSNQPLTITNRNNQRSTIHLASAPIMSNPQADLGCVILLQDAAGEREFESIQLDFVSMASHELRTPLTSIIGYLSVFLEENKHHLNDQQRQFLDRILISARQLATLIENLLNVSKVERGALRMATHSIDWVKNLTQVVNDNQISASQKNITLKLVIDNPNLPAVKADNMRINEVLNNLIANAINYTEHGGSITVTSKQSGQEIITSVADTGQGIPKEAIPHLFTKFFRVSTALADSSNSKGTGLGLFLSKSIIDLHHGRIWAESEVGKGSTFSFTLPLA